VVVLDVGTSVIYSDQSWALSEIAFSIPTGRSSATIPGQ
jgi:hypothetical protein